MNLKINPKLLKDRTITKNSAEAKAAKAKENKRRAAIKTREKTSLLALLYKVTFDDKTRDSLFPPADLGLDKIIGNFGFDKPGKESVRSAIQEIDRTAFRFDEAAKAAEAGAATKRKKAEQSYERAVDGLMQELKKEFMGDIFPIIW